MKPRRWFRFSLRTLFVLLTVFGVWLGYQANIVRERSAMRRWIIERGGLVVDDEVAGTARTPGSEPKPLPAVRRMLGDRRVWLVEIPSAAHKDYSRVSAVFDDAAIILKPPK